MINKILAPNGCSSEEIKKSVTIEGNTIKTVLTYPNGFVLTVLYENGIFNVSSNGELIDLGNGFYQIPN